MAPRRRGSGGVPLAGIGTILFLLLGLPLLWGGIRLVGLGGSPYYVIAGIFLVVTAVLILRRHACALWLYAAILLGTILWALAEVGPDCWALTPRLVGPAILGPVVRHTGGSQRLRSRAADRRRRHRHCRRCSSSPSPC